MLCVPTSARLQLILTAVLVVVSAVCLYVLETRPPLPLHLEAQVSPAYLDEGTPRAGYPYPYFRCLSPRVWALDPSYRRKDNAFSVFHLPVCRSA